MHPVLIERCTQALSILNRLLSMRKVLLRARTCVDCLFSGSMLHNTNTAIAEQHCSRANESRSQSLSLHLLGHFCRMRVLDHSSTAFCISPLQGSICPHPRSRSVPSKGCTSFFIRTVSGGRVAVKAMIRPKNQSFQKGFWACQRKEFNINTAM